MKTKSCFLAKAIFALSISAPIVSYGAVIEGTDLHSANGENEAINAIFSGNRGNGGDQSMQFGDHLTGTSENDVIVGGLGIDVIFGKDGDDVILGGTEDFNPFNRDRAFGNAGNDIFVWAPGDGNDFFDGGAGIDTLVIGLVGEKTDLDGSESEFPVFNVNLPGTEGSQDFDGIFLSESGFPFVQLDGPGFCEVLDRTSVAPDGSDQYISDLNLDHLVRFSIKGVADNFEAGIGTDTGLRIAIHLKNTEFVICENRDGDSIDVFDLRTSPITQAEDSDLPQIVFDLLD